MYIGSALFLEITGLAVSLASKTVTDMFYVINKHQSPKNIGNLKEATVAGII